MGSQWRERILKRYQEQHFLYANHQMCLQSLFCGELN